jgi:RNA-directed DNA polymerase
MSFMTVKQQKKQMCLAFPAEGRGEAPSAVGKGTEAVRAGYETESQASPENLMEEVCQRDNLVKALKRVKANRGSPGIDGMKVEDLLDYLKDNWARIREQLLTGTYQPQPVKRVKISKPAGGERPLGIPTVLDRFIQQAVLQVLQRSWDQTFSEQSYGFRPGRSAHQAVSQAQAYIAQGYGYVVDIDLEKFFDRVNHDILMGLVAKRVQDKRILKLLRAYLNAGVLENGLVSPVTEGTPQGGPLSPLLSNLMLDVLDKDLERRGHRFVRYADDCNIYVRSLRAGERVMASVSQFLEKKLKLKVNQGKSAVARPGERKFLGFSFTFGEVPKRRIASQSLKRFRLKVKELTRIGRSLNLSLLVERLRLYLTGWRSYFGFCETPSVLSKLDKWIRRRLRMVQWRQWKRGRTRFAELRKRDVNHDLAARTAGSAHGPWRLSRSPALSFSLPNSYFISLGLPTLAPGR